MKLSRAEALAALSDTDPITLAEASKVLLRGVVSLSALRSEIRRGNLAVEKIGKNLFTTPAAIREMRERCAVKPKPDVGATSTLPADRDAERAALSATIAALKRRK
jgi:hypothetical protein